ncbi:MAG: tRNA pseudouridine(38-40) synthase TruA [Marinoscillum sp.]
MANWTHFHLIRIEFLGYRYHGWMKQPGLKTIHQMIDKTLLFILGHENFKTLGCSRTDAKVSAEDFAFELFTMETFELPKLLQLLNTNLPNDIRAKSISKVNSSFNIIQDVRVKEYHYHFTFGDRPHPFNAPTIHYFSENLDINLMKEAAGIFKGTHCFKRYVSKPSAGTQFDREILISEVVQNKESGLKQAYYFRIASTGFMRYQVRLMMGSLLDVGQGVISLEQLKESLEDSDKPPMFRIAPSSGLRLHRVTFK